MAAGGIKIDLMENIILALEEKIIGDNFSYNI